MGGKGGSGGGGGGRGGGSGEERGVRRLVCFLRLFVERGGEEVRMSEYCICKLT